MAMPCVFQGEAGSTQGMSATRDGPVNMQLSLVRAAQALAYSAKGEKAERKGRSEGGVVERAEKRQGKSEKGTSVGRCKAGWTGGRSTPSL